MFIPKWCITILYCLYTVIRDNPHIVFAAVGARDTSQYGLSRQEDDGRAGKPTGKAGRTRSLGLEQT